MITTKRFKKLETDIRSSLCGVPRIYHVATICAPSVILEMIVKNASIDCGIVMDWSYSGGRGVVWTDKCENIKRCRKELYHNIPTTDLTMADLC